MRFIPCPREPHVHGVKVPQPLSEHAELPRSGPTLRVDVFVSWRERSAVSCLMVRVSFVGSHIPCSVSIPSASERGAHKRVDNNMQRGLACVDSYRVPVVSVEILYEGTQPGVQ